MAPIAGKMLRDLPPGALAPAMDSPLARHLTALGEPGSFGMRMGSKCLAARAPNLRRLSCWPSLLAGSPFAETRWPAQLTDLKVSVALPRRAHLGDAAIIDRVTNQVNALLVSLAQLTQLERLSLGTLPSSYFVPAAITFAPLASLTRLQYLYCNFPFTYSRDLAATAAQAEQLKALTTLRELLLFGEAEMMALLLSPPHGWKQQELCSGWSEEVLRLLPTVPSLTRLRLNLRDGDATFLRELPNLTDLELSFYSRPPVDYAAVFAALQQCTKLTTLGLRGDKQLEFSSDALAGCLHRLPLLGSLRVDCARFGSLSFIAALPRQLRGLALRSLAPPEEGDFLPFAELDHIKSSLPGLERLLLDGIRFEGAAKEAVAEALRAGLPKLESCELR